jgi:sialic acid synthase SpsE
LYIVKDVKKGEKLTAENVKSIRPGFGLPPKHYEDVIGKIVIEDIAFGTPLHFGLIK